MPALPFSENEFLSQLRAVIEKNIVNEQFGVSELADEMNMSRSNLLRKVKKLTNLSVSQLISQVRLNQGMELLRTSSFNVSEVSHRVGFSSTSYFIKCFREHYGYPPGEVGKRALEQLGSEKNDENGALPVNQGSPAIAPKGRAWKRKALIQGAVGLVVALAIGLIIYYAGHSRTPMPARSIAVLPFKNDSNDSSNVYLINGLMESTLNNLQKIKDLKVISRTTAEKYRNTSKSIPEMANELNVNYFVEGSGQKIGDKILLNIQLIDGRNDKHLWNKQYRSESKDIFELQQEIAKNIAQEIQAIITPDEERNIEKKPTDDLVAYDHFLKGKDLFYQSTSQSLRDALPYFKKAIEQDNEFALAYANAVMVYYYLDMFNADKLYGAEINTYANSAMLYDPKLGESLIAKALSLAHRKEYELAVPYLEKALEYDPGSGLVVHFLTEFYSMHIFHTSKYMEYALLGVKLDIASPQDSATSSFKYFHLSNALLQCGFIDEAEKYINKSLRLNSENPFSGYLRAYVLYAKNKDLKQTKERMIKELMKDTTRFDILQEVGKVCYFMRDYKTSYHYYKKLIDLRERQQLDVFKSEDLKMGIVLSEIGQKDKAEEFVKSFKYFADNDRSIYNNLHLAGYYAYKKDTQKAIEHLKLFSKEDNFQYWVLFLEVDPAIESIKDLPEFKKVFRDIEDKFWNRHKKIRVMLEAEELL